MGLKFRYHYAMKRLYSQLIGIPLIVRDTPVKIGRVFNLLIDPDRGTLMAIQTTHAQMIAPVDLGEFKEDHWEIKHADAPIDENELVRVQLISKARRKLIHKKVITESGEELGMVADFMMEMTTLSLVQLYVVKRQWFFLIKENHLIDWKNILEITEEAIIVKDRHIKGREELEEYWQLKEKVSVPMPSH